MITLSVDNKKVWLVSYYEPNYKPLLPHGAIIVTGYNEKYSGALNDTDWYMITTFNEDVIHARFPSHGKSYDFPAQEAQHFKLPKKISLIIVEDELPPFPEIKKLCLRSLDQL